MPPGPNHGMARRGSDLALALNVSVCLSQEEGACGHHRHSLLLRIENWAEAKSKSLLNIPGVIPDPSVI